jgi:hypothetical protein
MGVAIGRFLCPERWDADGLSAVGRLRWLIGRDKSKKMERLLATSDDLSRKRLAVSAWARGLRRPEQLRRDEK